MLQALKNYAPRDREMQKKEKKMIIFSARTNGPVGRPQWLSDAE